MDHDLFRETMARWASGVTVVACMTDERVVATTVSAFMSLSLRPPLVLVALGANATVLPFLAPEAPFGVSILAASQRRLAMIHADPFPVGGEPFTGGAAPVLPGSLVTLRCTVRETREAGDHTLVIAAVQDGDFTVAAPLIRYQRRYHALDDD